MTELWDDNFNVINGYLRLYDEPDGPEGPDDDDPENDWVTGRDGKKYRTVPLPGCSKKVADRYESYMMAKLWGR